MDTYLDKTNDKLGMWSPRTAYMDWCEENYDVTFYVAEFWNTVSNIAFIINALIGLRQTAKDQPERRFFYLYLALLVVGVGSWGYHMTLRYTMHMADEIPMLWLVAVALYSIFLYAKELYSSNMIRKRWEVNAPPRRFNVTTAVILLIVTTMASTATALFNEVIYFHITFGIFLATHLVMTVKSVWTRDCTPSYIIASTIWLLIALSVWIVDRNLCSELRSFRYMLPRYAQPLLQLHAWWHLFSNLACAFNILFVYDMRCRHLRYTTKTKTKWGIFPYMEVCIAQKDMP